jgi:hypothetical protein
MPMVDCASVFALVFAAANAAVVPAVASFLKETEAA